MKKLIRLATVTLAAIGICTSAHAAKKKSIDFTEFKGSYTGTGTLTFGPQVFPCTVSINVAVPKSGASATVTVSGTIVISSTTYPMQNTFTFAKNKTATQSEVLYGIEAAGSPSTGTYSGKKAVLFNVQALVGSTQTTTQGTLAIKPQGKKKQRLLLTTALTLVGLPGTYVIALDTIGKKKTPKD